MTDKINLVYCSDKVCLRPAVVSAISAIKNLKSGKKIALHLLYRDVAADELNMLQRFFRAKFNIEFKYYAVPEHLSDKFHNENCPEKHISNAMFDRLFIHELIPEIDRAIYLDADMVVTGDLSELYEIDLQDKCIGAVIENPFEYDVEKVGYNAIRLMKLDIDTFYFNSGTLLLDLAKLRKINFINQCKEYFNKYQDKILWPDQDVLNAVLGKHTYFVSPKFNSIISDGHMTATEYREYFDFYGKVLPYSKYEIYAAVHKPTVLHYIGSDKPWIHPGRYYIHKEKYWQYYNMSPWMDKDSLLVAKKLNAAAAKHKTKTYKIDDFDHVANEFKINYDNLRLFIEEYV